MKTNNAGLISFSGVFAYTWVCLVTWLVLLNAMSGAGIISNDLGKVLRAMGNVVAALSLVLLLVKVPSVNINLSRLASLRLLIVFFLLFSVAVSLTVNYAEYSEAIKDLLLILYVTIVFVVTPILAAWANLPHVVAIMTRCFVNLMFVCSLVAVVGSVTDATASIRLGFPWNSGVFGFMMVSALIFVSFAKERSYWLVVWFFLMALLSGSRFSAFVGLVAMLGLLFAGKKTLKTVLASVFFAGAGAIASLYAVVHPPILLRPFTVERSDWASGRFDIWLSALDLIADRLVFGWGKDFVVFHAESDSLVVHNGFLEIAFRYGVIVAFLAYIVWISYFLDMTSGGHSSRRLRGFGASLVLLLLSRSLISNTFWLNLGDGVSMLFVVLVVVIARLVTSQNRVTIG